EPPPHPGRSLRQPPRLSVGAALHGSGRRAHPPRGGWAGGGGSGAAAARGAHVVVPVPQGDSGAGGGGAPGAGAGPGGVREVGQAVAPERLQLRAARGLDGRVDARAGAYPRHAGVPGLGRADRAAAGGGAPAALRAGGGGQWRAPHRRPAHALPLQGVAGVRALDAAVPGGPHRTGRLANAPAAQGGGGVRGALPRRALQGRAACAPGPRPHARQRPRERRQPPRLGGPARMGPPPLDRVRRQGRVLSRHRPAAAAHRAGGGGAAPHHAARRGALHPGGRGRRAGQGGGALAGLL
ncbi:MAG: Hydrolase, alpha/beta fold family protein, At1g52510/AT4G12830 homolog, group4, partial [uncultured Gemmatimonadetes bacterium]